MVAANFGRAVKQQARRDPRHRDHRRPPQRRLPGRASQRKRSGLEARGHRLEAAKSAKAESAASRPNPSV
jgi:hypothetical protein